MIKTLQELGDRMIGRFVPQVTAQAGLQEWTEVCGCFDIRKMGSPYRVFRRSCVAGAGCGACYATSQVC